MAKTLNESDQSESLNEDDKKILEEIRARYSTCEKSGLETRKLFKEDVEFRSGIQWDEKIRREREEDGRPCLVINKLNQSVNQITNEQRQNRPGINVHPVDDRGDIKTAKIAKGLIRTIEESSNAEAAYDTAFEYSATGGFGFFRIVTEYSSPTSFNQDLKIKRIRDPLTVRLDPNSTEPDGSDANYGFIHERISKDEYKRIYGNSELGASDANWNSFATSAPEWIDDNSCLVTEYFYKSYEEKDLVLLSNGQTCFKDALQNVLANFAVNGVPISATSERKTSTVKIKWVKTNGFEILERTGFPGIFIPIIPVYGSELVIDGKVILKGIVRDSKDPARMYNYMTSAEVEAIGLAPKAPFVAAIGQLEGFEDIWKTANRKNHSYLPYIPKSVDGTPVPPPQRQSFEPAVGAISQSAQRASEDIKATTGIYDAAMGARSNETSGIAINSRKIQAQNANFHLIDNLTRSIKHGGRILVYALPEVYDNARAARIIGDDGEEKMVRLNEPFDENGQQVIYTFESGKYDVTVDVGPSFQTKREEAVSSMLELTRSAPQAMQYATDLLVKNMDFPGSQEIADRIKKTLPPQIVNDDQGKGAPIPPQVQQQMQQMGQMIDVQTKKIHELADILDQNKLELESKERIEMKKLEVQLEIELAKLDAKDSLAVFDAEIKSIENRLSLINNQSPIQTQNFNPDQMDGGQYASPQMGNEPTGGYSPGQSMGGNAP